MSSGSSRRGRGWVRRCRGRSIAIVRLADSVRAYMPWGADRGLGLPARVRHSKASASPHRSALPTSSWGCSTSGNCPARIASTVGADYLGYRLVEGMVRSHGPGPFYVRVARDEALLVHHPDDLKFVLGGSPDPFASDPDAKRQGHGGISARRADDFAGPGLGGASAIRRGSPRYRQTDCTVSRRPFVRVARGHCQGNRVADPIRWQAFNKAFQRMTRRIVFGDTAADDTRCDATCWAS